MRFSKNWNFWLLLEPFQLCVWRNYSSEHKRSTLNLLKSARTFLFWYLLIFFAAESYLFFSQFFWCPIGWDNPGYFFMLSWFKCCLRMLTSCILWFRSRICFVKLYFCKWIQCLAISFMFFLLSVNELAPLSEVLFALYSR